MQSVFLLSASNIDRSKSNNEDWRLLLGRQWEPDRTGHGPRVIHTFGKFALAVKNLHVMNVEFYNGVGSTLDMPVMLPPVPQAVDFSAKKVLIADDVADSGRTLELVYSFVRDYVDEARTAVVYEKPQSIIKCDYVWKRTDAWINFPWSTQDPVLPGLGS